MKKGIISISILTVLFLLSSYFNGLFFALFMSLIAVLSLRELFIIRKEKNKLPIVVELLAYIIVVFFTLNNYDNSAYMIDYRLLSFLILVNLIPLIFINNKNIYNISDSLYVIGSTLCVGLTFNSLIMLRIYDLNYVLYIFCITFFTDLFAYITGKLIGKVKLTSISPNKTLEGYIGGTIMGTFVPTMFFISTINTSLPVYAIVIITLFLSLLGQIGDLVFSFIKREFNVKNFSNVVSFAGGILDVIDSVVFVTFGFIIVLSII